MKTLRIKDSRTSFEKRFNLRKDALTAMAQKANELELATRVSRTRSYGQCLPCIRRERKGSGVDVAI